MNKLSKKTKKTILYSTLGLAVAALIIIPSVTVSVLNKQNNVAQTILNNIKSKYLSSINIQSQNVSFFTASSALTLQNKKQTMQAVQAQLLSILNKNNTVTINNQTYKIDPASFVVLSLYLSSSSVNELVANIQFTYTNNKNQKQVANTNINVVGFTTQKTQNNNIEQSITKNYLKNITIANTNAALFTVQSALLNNNSATVMRAITAEIKNLIGSGKAWNQNGENGQALFNNFKVISLSSIKNNTSQILANVQFTYNNVSVVNSVIVSGFSSLQTQTNNICNYIAKQYLSNLSIANTAAAKFNVQSALTQVNQQTTINAIQAQIDDAIGASGKSWTQNGQTGIANSSDFKVSKISALSNSDDEIVAIIVFSYNGYNSTANINVSGFSLVNPSLSFVQNNNEQVAYSNNSGASIQLKWINQYNASVQNLTWYIKTANEKSYTSFNIYNSQDNLINLSLGNYLNNNQLFNSNGWVIVDIYVTYTLSENNQTFSGQVDPIQVAIYNNSPYQIGLYNNSTPSTQNIFVSQNNVLLKTINDLNSSLDIKSVVWQEEVAGSWYNISSSTNSSTTNPSLNLNLSSVGIFNYRLQYNLSNSSTPTYSNIITLNVTSLGSVQILANNQYYAPTTNITCANNQSVTLSISNTNSSFSNNINWTYQWQSLSAPSNIWTNVSGANSATYTFNTSNPGYGISYRLVMSNSTNANQQIISNVINVLTPVNYGTVAINATGVSNNTLVDTIDQPITFSVSFSGTSNISTSDQNVCYQWQEQTDGSNWTNINNATSNTYVLTTTTYENVNIRVVVSLKNNWNAQSGTSNTIAVQFPMSSNSLTNIKNDATTWLSNTNNITGLWQSWANSTSGKSALDTFLSKWMYGYQFDNSEISSALSSFSVTLRANDYFEFSANVISNLTLNGWTGQGTTMTLTAGDVISFDLPYTWKNNDSSISYSTGYVLNTNDYGTVSVTFNTSIYDNGSFNSTDQEQAAMPFGLSVVNSKGQNLLSNGLNYLSSNGFQKQDTTIPFNVFDLSGIASNGSFTFTTSNSNLPDFAQWQNQVFVWNDKPTNYTTNVTIKQLESSSAPSISVDPQITNLNNVTFTYQWYYEQSNGSSSTTPTQIPNATSVTLSLSFLKDEPVMSKWTLYCVVSYELHGQSYSQTSYDLYVNISNGSTI